MAVQLQTQFAVQWCFIWGVGGGGAGGIWLEQQFLYLKLIY